MNYTLLFHQYARLELQEAYDWYEQQRQGLGLEFLEAIDEVVQRILKNPLSCQVVYKNKRKAIPHRFPYLLIYEIHDDVILVTAVIHGSRNPKRWEDR